ncbi:MAG: hypothetical protein ACREI9_04190 [Nitrospiraceae bacterium]
MPYKNLEDRRRQRREWIRRWRKEHPDKAKKKACKDSRKWREKNPEKVKTNNRKYAEYQKEWRRKNPERVRAWLRKYDSTKGTPLGKLEANRRWRRRNPSKVSAIGAAYRKKHRGSALERSRLWRKKLSEDVKRFLGGKCVCCKIGEAELLSVDHVKNDGGGIKRRKNHYYYREIVAAFESGDSDRVSSVTAQYALRCYNCNWSKFVRRGLCLHEGGKLPKVGEQAMYFREIDGEVKRYLGCSCVCCGEVGRDFLSVDHVAGDGLKGRRNSNGTRNKYAYYFQIRKVFKAGDADAIEGIRKKFQILCRNCNSSKHYGKGVCVHKRL